jgi:hypothetical protein
MGAVVRITDAPAPRRFRPKPAQIDLEVWQDFLLRRRQLDDVRTSLEEMEREWSAQAYELLPLLVDPSTLEKIRA